MWIKNVDHLKNSISLMGLSPFLPPFQTSVLVMSLPRFPQSHPQSTHLSRNPHPLPAPIFLRPCFYWRPSSSFVISLYFLISRANPLAAKASSFGTSSFPGKASRIMQEFRKSQPRLPLCYVDCFGLKVTSGSRETSLPRRT